MKKTVISLILITILSKMVGFARDIALAYYYGTTNISDVFLVSLTIPTVIFAFIGAGISTAYIPMYNRIALNQGETEANIYTNNLMHNILIICMFLILFGFLFTDKIVLLFASGFSGETLILASHFTRITLIALFFTGLVYVFQGFLQIKEQYAISTLVGLPLNLIVLIFIILSTRTSLIFLAIGSVIASASQLLLLVPVAYKKGYRYKFVVGYKNKYMTDMALIAIPVILGVSVNQINVLIDRTIASQLSIGGISALTYANRLNGFVVSIFVLSIATILYPVISKMAVDNNMIGFKKAVSDSLNSISLLLIPSTVGFMVFSEPIVQLLFGRGAFNNDAILMTAGALFYYSIGMVSFSYREIIAKAFYSLQDTKTPMINAVIGMVLNIILNIILSKYIGIEGLALATSIAAIASMLLMFISLRKKIGPLGMKQLSISFLKILFASLVMGALAKLSFNYLTASLSQNLSLLLAIGVGAVSYFIIIYFLKIEDVDVIVGAIKKKFGKGAA